MKSALADSNCLIDFKIYGRISLGDLLLTAISSSKNFGNDTLEISIPRIVLRPFHS